MEEKKVIASPFSDGLASLVVGKTVITYRKEPFEIERQMYKCDETGIEFSTEEQDQEAVKQVYDQYRKKHGIPFPEEIKEIRMRYGLSCAKMSLVLGFGINQYNSYEAGEVPSLSNAKLILAVKELSFFKILLNLVKDELGEKTYLKIVNRLSTKQDHLPLIVAEEAKEYENQKDI